MNKGKKLLAAVVIFAAAGLCVFGVVHGKKDSGADAVVTEEERKDGINENGHLRLVFGYNSDDRAQCYVTDSDIIIKTKDYRKGDYEMFEFEPLKNGKTNIVTRNSAGGDREYRMYHITVSSELSVSFTKESIDRDTFDTVTGLKKQ